MATTVRTQDYYVTEIDTQHPVGVYEAATSYQATTLAAYEWSVSPDQLTAQEMPALPGRYASLSIFRNATREQTVTDATFTIHTLDASASQEGRS